MIVTIDGVGEVNASELDVLRLVASSKGYEEVDVEPWGDGKVTIKATPGGGGTPVSTTGKTVIAAVEKMLRLVLT